MFALIIPTEIAHLYKEIISGCILLQPARQVTMKNITKLTDYIEAFRLQEVISAIQILLDFSWAIYKNIYRIL